MTENPQILRRTERRFAPWKNGAGRTAEILAMPEGATIDDFDWRISTAEVSQSGPFSIFPEIDRWLTVLEGGAMTLLLPDRAMDLAPGSEPVHFPGDVPCSAELSGDPLLDLNIMTRRPLSAQIGAAPAPDPVLARYALALVDCPEVGLARHDLAIGDPGAAPHGALLWIEILAPE